MATIKDLNDKFVKLDKLYNEFGLDSLGCSIKDYIVPDRGRFTATSANPTDRNAYARNDRKYVIEDTGEQAANFLVGGFMSMLTPSTSPWFRLKPAMEELAQIKRVGEWYDAVTKMVLDVYNDTDVYNVLYSTYLEMITFGTAAQMIESDVLDSIRPVSFTFGEYRIATNGKNKIDTFAYQCYQYAHELADRFGEDGLSENAKRALKNNEPTLFKVRWIVTPNDGRLGFTSGSKDFVSVYWEADRPSHEDGALEIKGFEEFPLQVPRYSTISNDTYGKESPGQKQLANIKMLQSLTEDYLIAIKRVGDPPMVSDGNHSMINTLPGGLTEAPNSVGGSIGVRPMFERDPNFPAIREGIEYWKRIINEGFFTHLLLIISGAENDRKTAAEIIARNEEKYGFLGSVLNRVFKEVLKPMIERTINILARDGMFDEDGPLPMPPELVDQEYDINFTSLLAQAQEAIGLNQLDRFIERMSIVADIKPEVLDKIDADAITELYGKTVPTKALLDTEQVEELRAIKAQQQAMAQQMAMLESTSDSVNKLAGADTSGENALTDMAAAEEAGGL